MNKLLIALLISFLSVHTYGQSLESIIPAPLVVKKATGSFLFNANTVLAVEVKDTAPLQFFYSYLEKNMSIRVLKSKPKDKYVTKVLFTDAGTGSFSEEAYELSITPKLITVRGKKAGLFYAIQSLIQLFPIEKSAKALIPCGEIKDSPRFGYRGLMLDVSRHFFTVDQVKAVLDLMAAYKLNRFHWHLTDDQGWRIEIKSFPKLTEVGAWRVPRKDFGMEPPRPGEKATDGGYYTQEQIRDVVKYAAQRHIQIMPEIDVPGHSMAAIAAYPELSVTKNKETKVNPGSSFARWFPTGGFEMYVDNTLNPSDEKVYAFLDQVFTEVASLFPYEYIHIGGDECFKGFWEKDAQVKKFMTSMNIPNTHALQSYFTNRVSKIIRSKNKKAIGWDEIFDKDQEQEVAIMNRFGEAGALAQTKRKLNIILAPGNNGLYFDYAQSYSEMEPSSHGQFSPLWKAYQYTAQYNGMTDSEKARVLGVEACIWTESIPSMSKLEYMMLPRLFALSETGWSALAHKNYESFKKRALPIHLARLDHKGINYRVPTVFDYTDSVLIGKKFNIEMKAPLPGSKIFYTLNNRFPSDADHLYTAPIELNLADDKRYVLKSFILTPSGRRSVVTRTLLYNPTIKKSVNPIASRAGLMFWSTNLEEGRIDSGVTALSLPSSLNPKNLLTLRKGYILIPEDGYYEFSASPKAVSISIGKSKVLDVNLPYPKFDKADPLYLQKGYHPIRIEQFQNFESTARIYFNRLNEKPVELKEKDFRH